MADQAQIKKGLARLKSGDFNYRHSVIQPDGSEVITLSSEHYPETYRFQVRNLYQEDEEVFDESTGQFASTRDL